MALITWDSVPEYDDWGFSPNMWTGIDWLNWHVALVSHYGKAEADNRWSQAWLAGVSTFGGGTGTAPGAGTVSDSVPIDDRTFNDAFRNYLNAPGNELLHAAVFSGVLGETIGETISTAADVVDDAGNVVRSISSGASATAKVLETALPILLILLLVGGTIYLSKKSGVLK